MVNKELLEWIKSSEGKGYSEEALTKILVKQGRKEKDIKAAFAALKISKTPASVAIDLGIGLGAISFVLVLIALPITIFSLGEIGGYVVFALLGLLIGFYTYYLKKKLMGTEKLGAMLGIFPPILSLILIMALLKLVPKVSARLMTSSLADGTGLLAGLGNSLPDALIVIVLFYLLVNVFMIVDIFRKKKYPVLIWYVLVPAILFGVWILIDLLMSGVGRWL